MEFIAAAEPGASCFPDDGCNFPLLVSWSPSRSMHSSRTNVYHCVSVHHCDAYWLNIGLFHCAVGVSSLRVGAILLGCQMLSRYPFGL